MKLLGKTGVRVSRVALGTMAFGGEADEPTAAAIWRAARDAGVNLIDTADVYNEGRSEQILGRLMKHERDPRDLDAGLSEELHRLNAASMRFSTFSSLADTLPKPRMPPAAAATILANPTIWFLSSRFCSSLSCDASALM